MSRPVRNEHKTVPLVDNQVLAPFKLRVIPSIVIRRTEMKPETVYDSSRFDLCRPAKRYVSEPVVRAVNVRYIFGLRVTTTTIKTKLRRD